MEADMAQDDYKDWRHEEGATETEIDNILDSLRE
jgi:hypothetical protein